MNIYTIAVGISLILFTAIGLFMSRSVNTKEDYFVAGRNAGVLLIVGTLAASYLSTVAMMGEAGMAYDGYPWIILMMGGLVQLGYIVGVILFGRYLRESNSLTIPEYFGRRFNSKRLQLLSGLMVLIGIGLYLVAVTRGISLVLQTITGIDEIWAIALTWLVFSAFTVLSGSKGVIVTDTVMFLVFVFGGGAAFLYIIHKAGGFDDSLRRLASDDTLREGLLWHGILSSEGALFTNKLDAFIYVITYGVVWMCVLSVSPWQASRYMMAKTNQVAIRSGLVAVVAVTAFYALMLTAAYSVRLINPDISPSENVIIWCAYNLLPTSLGVAVIVGIMAAGLSSASTFLSLVGFSAVNDVLNVVRKSSEHRSDLDTLKESRIAMLVVGLIALLVTALATPGVLQIGYMAASFFAAGWGIVAIASTQSRKISERGAFWGMAMGGTVVLVLECFSTFGNLQLPTSLNPVFFGLLSSAAGVFIGSTTKKAKESNIEYLDTLHRAIRATSTPTEVRTTKKYVIATGCCLLALYVGIAMFYFPNMLPYVS